MTTLAISAGSIVNILPQRKQFENKRIIFITVAILYLKKKVVEFQENLNEKIDSLKVIVTRLKESAEIIGLI